MGTEGRNDPNNVHTGEEMNNNLKKSSAISLSHSTILKDLRRKFYKE
jgi:hypothetical protein